MEKENENDILRKRLTIFSAVIIIWMILSQWLLPFLAERTLVSRIGAALQTEEVTAKVYGMPALGILFGHVDRIFMTARNPLLGDVRAAQMTLTGENVELSPEHFMQGEFMVKRADLLRLDAVLTAENLADLLQRKVDKLQKVKAEITADLVLLDGEVKVWGQKVDVHIEGKVLEEENRLCFRMTRLNIKNGFFGGDLMGSLFVDVDLVDFRLLYLPLTLDSVEHQAGKILLTASYHGGK